MKLLTEELRADLAAPVSAALYVVTIAFDDGARHLAERGGVVAGDVLIGAVDSWGQIAESAVTFDVALDAVPASAFPWVRRAATLREVALDAPGVHAGAVVFDGLVAEEPEQRGGILRVRLERRRRQAAAVPSGLPIAPPLYPRAAPSAVGKLLPEIWGRVAGCELLPIDRPAWSRLETTCAIGATSFEIDDARGFAASGAVTIDGESYVYASRTDRALLGVRARRPHVVGAVVAQAGPWRFAAAGHAVDAIEDLAAGGALLDPARATVDLAAAEVAFAAPPLVRGTSQPFNVALQFDRVSSSGTQLYEVDYPILGQDAADEPIWGDLDGLIVPPEYVAAGTYSMVVTWAAQPNPALSNPFAYTAYLGGVAVALDAAGGTRTVGVPIASNAPIALTHAVNGGANQIVPRIVSVGVTWTVAANPKPALNPVNAIMGATGTVSQSAVLLPPPVTEAAEGAITFARPSTDRIISGLYTVLFSVSGASSAPLRVTIGNDVVWARDGGVVIYDFNPASLQYDTDTDVLPVRVEGAGATVTVLAASRVVTTGNLDQANYATLRWPDNTILRADQTTENPDRGPISRARLVVEWFSTASLSGNVAVRFAGLALGNLTAQAVTSETITRTVAVDIVNQGAAKLTNGTNIAVSVGGGTASLSSTVSVVRQTYSVAYVQHPSVAGFWYARLRVTPPQNVVAGVHVATIQTQPIGAGNTSVGIYDDLRGGFGGPTGRTATISPNATVSSGFFLEAANSTIPVGFAHDVLNANEPRVASISVDWNVTPTTVTSVPASGSTSVPNDQLPNSGIVASGGTLAFTLPAPPRATVQGFDLPFRDWSDFTGKTVELEYQAGTSAADVGIVQVQLLVDYDQIEYSVAGADEMPLTATVTGRSGNPADVLRDLAARRALRVAGAPYRRLHDWATATGFALARRLDEATDAVELTQSAAQAALVRLFDTEDGLAFVRELDLAAGTMPVAAGDVLDADPAIEWSQVETRANELVLRYAVAGDKPTRALTYNADASTPPGARVWAVRGQRELGARQRFELTSLWLADDVSAARFAADWLRLNAPLRRLLTATLPYAFGALEGGDAIRYAPHDAVYRVLEIGRDAGGAVLIKAEEIPE